jgi:monoterpene epsilon-lactone hydrolase
MTRQWVTAGAALGAVLLACFASASSAADCRTAPPQPPLPDTVSAEAKAALAPIFAAAPTAAAEPDVAQMRAFADATQEQLSKRQLQHYRVRIEAGRVANVPVRIFIPDERPRAPDTVLINLHGGGFVVDSGSLTENVPLAALTRTRIVSVLYRLAPEHPFPAAVDDAVAVYREMLKTYRPARIALYGTSAGATLAAQVLVRAKSAGLPMPAALGFFSAPADFERVSDSEQYLPRINGRCIPDVLAPYSAGTDRRNPGLSPIYADLGGFPPSLLLAGTRDPLLSQTALFQRALLRAGVDAQLVVFEAMPHAHWAWLELPESTEAFEIMAKFFDRRLFP